MPRQGSARRSAAAPARAGVPGPCLVHMPSEPSGSQRSPTVFSGTSFAQVVGAILGKQARGRSLIRPPWPAAATRDENRVGPLPSPRPRPPRHPRTPRRITGDSPFRMRSLTARPASSTCSRAGTGASRSLDFRHRICYGARGQDGFGDATREEERRRAPHLREVVPIGSPCEQRRTCWGSERLHFAPAPGRSSPVVPFACHIGRSIPVPSGQSRSHLRHRRAGRPRRTSLNASREHA